MSQAPNKMYSRAEVRAELMELRNNTSRIAMHHRDAFRKDPNHDETKCKMCDDWASRISAYEIAIRHFGGRI